MTDKYKEKMNKDKYIELIKKLTPVTSHQGMEDAYWDLWVLGLRYGDSYKNPAYQPKKRMERWNILKRKRRRDEGG